MFLIELTFVQMHKVCKALSIWIKCATILHKQLSTDLCFFYFTDLQIFKKSTIFNYISTGENSWTKNFFSQVLNMFEITNLIKLT